MTRRLAGALAGLLVLAGCGGSTTDAAASCAGPAVTVEPTAFAAGDSVRVEGTRYFDDCYDTGQTGTPPATQDIVVRLTTSGGTPKAFPLATVDAHGDGEFTASVRIPVDVPPGPAHIEAGYADPAEVVVTSP
jgi:hypothetical protein